MQPLDPKPDSSHSTTVKQQNEGPASSPCIGDVLLPIDLVTVQREGEGCNVTDRVYVRVAGLQLAVDLQDAHSKVAPCWRRLQEACYVEAIPRLLL